MNIQFFLKNKLFITLFFALILGFGLLIIIQVKVFQVWQLQLSDNLYAGHTPNKDIVMVLLDDKSISEQEGLGHFESWNRSYFAKVLENINRYNPKIVAFDVFFHLPKDSESDLKFKEALSKTNHPIIIYPLTISGLDKKGYYVQTKQKILTNGPLELFRKIPQLIISAANIIPDQDNVRRKIIPGVYDENKNFFYENMAFIMARLFLGNPDSSTPSLFSTNSFNLNINNNKLEIPLEDGQMLINYSTIPGKTSYQHVSFVDVYNEKYSISPEKLFKDKIVIIGGASFYFKDSLYVPTSKQAQMWGVEVHANALQTILEQKFLRNLTFSEEMILLLLICLAAAFTFMYTKIRWSVLALVGSATLYSLLAKPLFDHGIILDLVHPYLGLAGVFMATYIYRYVTEFREKNALKGAFAKYVNPKVVEQIIAHPENLKLGGEKREVSILFTDIAHFTSISEQLKPESLVALLNEYFEAMTSVILEEAGTLDKFEGDAIMAFFGAPLPQTDHALRACRAAIKMRQKLVLLLQKWETDPPLPGGEKKPCIDFRTGIHSGEVIVGNMGSNERFDYTVMGDNVNVASRLEGANKKYQSRIMVSETTYLAVKECFESRELDVIKVVGKNQPIKVYELLNEKGKLIPEAEKLLELYRQGLELYHQRKFSEALEQFNALLKQYPNDGPSQLYKQRCEVLKDFPPPADWDGVFEMGNK